MYVAYHKCDLCGGEIRDDELVQSDQIPGKNICRACKLRIETPIQCGRCGKPVAYLDAIQGGEYGLVCQGCYDRIFPDGQSYE